MAEQAFVPPEYANAMREERRWELEAQHPILGQLVADLKYKDGWRFDLMRPFSPSVPYAPVHLVVRIQTIDSETGKQVEIAHSLPVPPMDDRDERWWRRWLLERIFDVERHEAMEFFQIGDSKPFFPNHGAGNPYAVVERD